MVMKEYYDGDWLVVDIVPDFIEAHSARCFGSPTIKGTRVHTEVGAGAYINSEWRDYRIKKQQAFVAYVFEAGREFQRSRTLRKKIDDAVDFGWSKINESTS